MAQNETPSTNCSTENKISDKEMDGIIKKLKRNKSLGPDKIPNEIFIEANRETKQLLKTMIENIHITEYTPPPKLGRRWNHKTLQRERPEREML